MGFRKKDLNTRKVVVTVSSPYQRLAWNFLVLPIAFFEERRGKTLLAESECTSGKPQERRAKFDGAHMCFEPNKCRIYFHSLFS